MSWSTEVKNYLKNAKELIKNKEFSESLKVCKFIIDKEKDNYLAWVFTGLAACELGSKEQSLAAFQRAIQISPEQPTAWQGLAQLHEKNSMFNELTSVYGELRQLFKSDINKYYDFSIKYSNCLTIQSKIFEAISVYHSLLQTSNLDESKIVFLCEKLIHLLSDAQNLTSTKTTKISDIYFDVIQCAKVNNLKLNKDILIKVNEKALISLVNEDDNDWKRIESICYQILDEIDPKNEKAIEILLQIYAELSFANYSSIQTEKIEQLLTKIDNEKSPLAYFKLFFDAKKLLVNNFNIPQQNINDLKVIIDKSRDQNKEGTILFVYLQNLYSFYTCDHSKCVETSNNGLKLIPQLIIKEMNQFYEGAFLFNEGYSFYLQNEFNRAIEIFNKVLINYFKIEFLNQN
jgi:tetratricopeptide (TPR) repeat protein